MSSDTREAVAGVQHEIWSHWMRYLFNMARHNPDGSVTISADLVDRWTRQIETRYADLTEREQESDRHQADKVLLAMGWTLVETPCDCTPESRPFCWRCQRTGVRTSTAPANQENSEAEKRLRAQLDAWVELHKMQSALPSREEDDAKMADQERKIKAAISLAVQYGQIPGDHHKTWVIDQVLRILAGSDYAEIIQAACDGEDGPDTYMWNVGIAP